MRRLACSKDRDSLHRQAMEVTNVSKGHNRRKAMIRRQFAAAKRRPLVLLRTWQLVMAPSTAYSYARTLMAMVPEMKTPQVKVVLDAMRQKNTLQSTRRAKPFTPKTFRMFLKRVARRNFRVAKTAWWMWVSTSRHADLLGIHGVQRFSGGIMLRWSRFKSDRYGVRAVSKAITVAPRDACYLDQSGTGLPAWCSYRALLKEVKAEFPEMTTYSLRRGSATCLAEAGYPMQEIGLMTAHTPTADPCLAVRRYVDQSPAQPESLLQRAMSRMLANSLE